MSTTAATSSTATSQHVAVPLSIDETIEAIVGPVAELLDKVVFVTVPILGADVPLIVGWLVAGGIFFSFYLKFLGIRGVKHAIDLARGKYDRPTQMARPLTSKRCRPR